MHFNYDFDLVFYLAACIFFLILHLKRRGALEPRPKKLLKSDKVQRELDKCFKEISITDKEASTEEDVEAF